MTLFTLNEGVAVCGEVGIICTNMAFYSFYGNGRDSFQQFVGVFDTYLVFYLLVLPSETHAVANMTS